MPANRQGEFVVIEGIDGSGKDTQADLLVDGMQRHGRRVFRTTSPTSWYRQQPAVRAFIEDGVQAVSADELAALAATDRMMACEREIDPALQAGMGVVCVRYVFSTYAYFKERGADMALVEALNSQVTPPTHGVLLEIDPEEAVARVVRRGGKRTFEERAAYLGRVQAEMLRRWPDRFLTLDATLPAVKLAATALDYVMALPEVEDEDI